MNDYHNKNVLITGGSKGVGAEVARQFAKRGANLILVAREQAALDRIVKELSSQTQVLSFTCDIGQISQLEKLVTYVRHQFGSLDVLVNNAGLHHRGEFKNLTANDVHTMIQVNLTAPLTLTKLCLPLLQQSDSSAVVMVGSLAGRAPLQGAAVYSATKAGLRAFTYALYDELISHNVKIAIVSPGPIDTGFIMDEIDKVEDIVYSQPMSSAVQVAESVIDVCAITSNVESVMPWFSGKLTTLGYLFPMFRRLTRPLLYKIGARNKLKYKKRNES